MKFLIVRCFLSTYKVRIALIYAEKAKLEDAQRFLKNFCIPHRRSLTSAIMMYTRSGDEAPRILESSAYLAFVMF